MTKLENLSEVKSFLIDPATTVRESMEILNNCTSLTHTLFVIDSENHLLGTVTDGDIRRALLKNVGLNNSISFAMNKNYQYVLSSHDYSLKLRELKVNGIDQIPVLDESRKLINILNLNYVTTAPIRPNPVVIMAGGEGRRLRPATNNCPKPMLKINGKPMLETLVERFVEFGFQNIFISVNYLKEQIMDYFEDGLKWGAKITYLIEDHPLGTAGSLHLLKGKIDETFLVTNGDVLSSINPTKVIKYHHDNDSDMTLCAHQYETTVPFGVLSIENSRVKKIVEKPKITNLVNAGFYCLKPSLLELIPNDTYLDMPDLVNLANQSNNHVSAYPIYEYWLDVGRPETYEQAKSDFNL